MRLRARLDASSQEKAVTIATVEEQVRGRLDQLRQQRDVHQQVAPYARLQRQIEMIARWLVLPWDAEAAEFFTHFRRQGVRIGTMDLKIACIALAFDVTLLTRNARDFSQVPGLRFENWLD